MIAVPCFVPSLRAATPPSERITIGAIGVGRMGMGDLRETLGFGDVQVLAVCDVDANRADFARRTVDQHYAARNQAGSYRGCDVYADYRQLIARDDIDAVLVCTPDHWHALPAVDAARAGKDIFLQKPLTYSIREGRILSDTVTSLGRVLQVGSQQRSDARFRFACELVRNGRIGKLKRIEVGVPVDPPGGDPTPMPVPKGLDYDMWLGPAPWAPYTEERVQPQQGYSRPGWLRITDYCLGMMTGWGSHHMDIAHWGMGLERSGPMTVEGAAEFPTNGLWDVAGKFHIEYTYANGVALSFTENTTNKQGVTFRGSDGWVYVRRGYIDAGPKSLLRTTFGPNHTRLPRSTDHKADWFESIRTRREPIAPVEVGHRSNSACVLGWIATQLGRKLRWNPATERFLDDDPANRLLNRPAREPWLL